MTYIYKLKRRFQWKLWMDYITIGIVSGAMALTFFTMYAWLVLS